MPPPVVRIDRAQPDAGAVAEGERHWDHPGGETLAGFGHDPVRHAGDRKQPGERHPSAPQAAHLGHGGDR
jgi:hypothetical protein